MTDIERQMAILHADLHRAVRRIADLEREIAHARYMLAETQRAVGAVLDEMRQSRVQS